MSDIKKKLKTLHERIAKISEDTVNFKDKANERLQKLIKITKGLKAKAETCNATDEDMEEKKKELEDLINKKNDIVNDIIKEYLESEKRKISDGYYNVKDEKEKKELKELGFISEEELSSLYTKNDELEKQINEALKDLDELQKSSGKNHASVSETIKELENEILGVEKYLMPEAIKERQEKEEEEEENKILGVTGTSEDGQTLQTDDDADDDNTYKNLSNLFNEEATVGGKKKKTKRRKLTRKKNKKSRKKRSRSHK